MFLPFYGIFIIPQKEHLSISTIKFIKCALMICKIQQYSKELGMIHQSSFTL